MALNIIFMGTPDFAVPILKSINNLNHNILEVYTQPPNKKNRGQKIQNSPIHDYSNKLNLPVRCPIAFNEEEINRIIHSFTGFQDQTPPKASAVKVNGKRANAKTHRN